MNQNTSGTDLSKVWDTLPEWAKEIIASLEFSRAMWNELPEGIKNDVKDIRKEGFRLLESPNKYKVNTSEALTDIIDAILRQH